MTILAAWLPTRHIPKKLLGRRCPFVQQLRSYFAIELYLVVTMESCDDGINF